MLMHWDNHKEGMIIYIRWAQWDEHVANQKEKELALFRLESGLNNRGGSKLIMLVKKTGEDCQEFKNTISNFREQEPA